MSGGTMAFPEHHMIQEILEAYAGRVAADVADAADEQQPLIESFHIQLLTLSPQQLDVVHQEWCL
jgi:hypothetical protein